MRRLVFISILIFATGLIHGQDPQFSNLMMTRNYINPAYVGHSQNLNVEFAHRSQWHNVPSKFKTSYFNVDAYCPRSKFGFGMYATNNKEGEGAIRTNNVNGILSYTIGGQSRPNKGFTVVSAALQFGILGKRIDWSKLVFSDQLDARYGNVNQTNANPRPESTGIMPDLGGGVVWRTYFGGYNKNRMRRSGGYFTAGVAVQHLNEPTESFLGLQTRLPARWNFHGNVVFKTQKKGSRTAPEHFFGYNLLYQQQGQLRTVTTGPSLAYNNLFVINLWWRGNFGNFTHTESVILSGMINFNSFSVEKAEGGGKKIGRSSDKISVGFSYDFTTRPLDFRNTYGTFEIIFRYDFNRTYLCSLVSRREKKKMRKVRNTCPSPGGTNTQMLGNNPTKKEQSQKLKRVGRNIELYKIGL